MENFCKLYNANKECFQNNLGSQCSKEFGKFTMDRFVPISALGHQAESPFGE